MLGTQWAIREAVQLADDPPLRHLIKAEAPLDASRDTWAARIEEAVHTSCETLGIERVNTVVWELDLKRTRDVSLLAAADAVREFVTMGSVLVRNTGRVDSVVAYCHSPHHLLAATAAGGIDGIALAATSSPLSAESPQEIARQWLRRLDWAQTRMKVAPPRRYTRSSSKTSSKGRSVD